MPERQTLPADEASVVMSRMVLLLLLSRDLAKAKVEPLLVRFIAVPPARVAVDSTRALLTYSSVIT